MKSRPYLVALGLVLSMTQAAPAAPDSDAYDAGSPAPPEYNSPGPPSIEYQSPEPDSTKGGSPAPEATESVPLPVTDPGEPDSQEKKPFKLHAKRDQAIERPYWIPARAYAVTDDTTHYRWVIGFITIEKRLPNHPTTTLLSRSTSKYWRGFLPRPCFVRVLPDRSAPEGNFIFFTVGYKNGPRGWLQYAGLDKKGRPHYRYWFDPL